jgi:hypothetical protein
MATGPGYMQPILDWQLYIPFITAASLETMNAGSLTTQISALDQATQTPPTNDSLLDQQCKELLSLNQTRLEKIRDIRVLTDLTKGFHPTVHQTVETLTELPIQQFIQYQIEVQNIAERTLEYLNQSTGCQISATVTQLNSFRTTPTDDLFNRIQTTFAQLKARHQAATEFSNSKMFEVPYEQKSIYLDHAKQIENLNQLIEPGMIPAEIFRLLALLQQHRISAKAEEAALFNELKGFIDQLPMTRQGELDGCVYNRSSVAKPEEGWGKNHRYDDLYLLKKSISDIETSPNELSNITTSINNLIKNRNSAKEKGNELLGKLHNKFDQLSQEQKKVIDGHVSRLSSNQESNWGTMHRYDELNVLKKAISALYQTQIEEQLTEQSFTSEEITAFYKELHQIAFGPSSDDPAEWAKQELPVLMQFVSMAQDQVIEKRPAENVEQGSDYEDFYVNDDPSIDMRKSINQRAQPSVAEKIVPELEALNLEFSDKKQRIQRLAQSHRLNEDYCQKYIAKELEMLPVRAKQILEKYYPPEEIAAFEQHINDLPALIEAIKLDDLNTLKKEIPIAYQKEIEEQLRKQSQFTEAEIDEFYNKLHQMAQGPASVNPVEWAKQELPQRMQFVSTARDQVIEQRSMVVDEVVTEELSESSVAEKIVSELQTLNTRSSNVLKRLQKLADSHSLNKDYPQKYIAQEIQMQLAQTKDILQKHLQTEQIAQFDSKMSDLPALIAAVQDADLS